MKNSFLIFLRKFLFERMKRKVLCVIACCIGIASFAEQLPHYTQYVLNGYILNPAIAGIENYTDVKMSLRHQWVGIDEAPVTTYLTIHRPLKRRDYERETPTGFHASGEKSERKSLLAGLYKGRPHAGAMV